MQMGMEMEIGMQRGMKLEIGMEMGIEIKNKKINK